VPQARQTGRAGSCSIAILARRSISDARRCNALRQPALSCPSSVQPKRA
jgi:hypothetical protein